MAGYTIRCLPKKFPEASAPLVDIPFNSGYWVSYCFFFAQYGLDITIPANTTKPIETFSKIRFLDL